MAKLAITFYKYNSLKDAMVLRILSIDHFNAFALGTHNFWFGGIGSHSGADLRRGVLASVTMFWWATVLILRTVLFGNRIKSLKQAWLFIQLPNNPAFQAGLPFKTSLRLRSERDSNSRYAFGAHTLSRPLRVGSKSLVTNQLLNSD